MDPRPLVALGLEPEDSGCSCARRAATAPAEADRPCARNRRPAPDSPSALRDLSRAVTAAVSKGLRQAEAVAICGDYDGPWL